MASKNTQKVNERLALAEQAAASGNFEAAVNYAQAAAAYSKSESSNQNISNILGAYTAAANVNTSPIPAPTVTPAGPTNTGGGGGGGVSTSSYPPAPASTPPSPYWITNPTVSTPAGIRQADPDIVLDPEIDTSGDYIVERFFEELGGTELINLSRHDLIDGIDVSYNPIANLSNLRRRFNPNNIIAIDYLSQDEFSRTSIDLLSRGIYEPYFNDDGNLVIEIDIIKSEENIETEISQTGTVSRIEL